MVATAIVAASARWFPSSQEWDASNGASFPEAGFATNTHIARWISPCAIRNAIKMNRHISLTYLPMSVPM
jgi:hypothetical protein